MKKKTFHDVIADSIKQPLPIITNYWSSRQPVFKETHKLKTSHKKFLRTVNNTKSLDMRVFYCGDFTITKRIQMKNLGLDLGTRNIILAFREDDGSVGYIRETNGYWPFERATPFIKNILNDPNKIRSDGTKRPARWVEIDGQAILLGKDAEEFAYAKNDTLRRPMAEGGVSADEEAMNILSIIVRGLLETAEKDVGVFETDMKLCYCTTAPALNKELNLDYHERVVDIILSQYSSETKIETNTIKESHAIVLDSSEDGTGIGISWGAGTVTVSYVKYGIEIYSFCWVGAGDWIDINVAMRHGFDVSSKSKSKETPTTVSKRKESVDLNPGKEPDDRLGLDICLHYDILIKNVIIGVAQGFVDNENEARIEGGINLYMAGGTSCPDGFTERVAKLIKEIEVPFEVSQVTRSKDPLFTVARGCLTASEMF